MEEPEHLVEEQHEPSVVDKSEPLNSSRKMGLSSLIIGVIYFFSNPRDQSPFDYTFRVAENLMRGNLSFTEQPPSWLNEFVLANGAYHTVFSLGAVLSMVPFALLKMLGFVKVAPVALIVGILAAGLSYFLLKIAEKYDISFSRRLLYTLAILLGTFMWANLTFGGAWQLALGFAMVGEAGAIYFTVYNRRPFLAGLFFALAFGNRTENLLTAPVFLFLLARDEYSPDERLKGDEATDPAEVTDADLPGSKGFVAKYFPQFSIARTAAFCAIPFLLGVATLYYNFIRFDSISDFGHARINGVLDEPWYKHGIFSIYYIPRQMWEMLIKGWEWRDSVPYLRPNGFGNTILVSSPFLLFAFRDGARDYAIKYGAWIAILFLTILLWMHGNSGGWQFGYRYAMVLLPWIFVLLLETARRKLATIEWVAYTISFLFGIYTIWLYHWSDYMKP
ncbi:MAG TPA: hypothetical protein PLP21_16150 [Pyrinomonadaceae bacterium]|nr:hypothetical protein [Acidobacteriota bacterium]HQZ97855.1 hypothetical protein [Pyrinomonadaceae bacterium]